jgi:hypothetical protein
MDQAKVLILHCSSVGFNVKLLIYGVYRVSEIRVLILTSERTRQFMKLFSITFCKIRKSILRFFVPQFLPNESFCVINWFLFFVTMRI